jgi:hypothetical protein
VCDRSNARFQIFDADGNSVDSFGSFGTEHGQFQLGHDIAVARDGSVYVAEGKGRCVQKFIRRIGPSRRGR